MCCISGAILPLNEITVLHDTATHCIVLVKVVVSHLLSPTGTSVDIKVVLRDLLGRQLLALGVGAARPCSFSISVLSLRFSSSSSILFYLNLLI